jgi:hypothetical protein
MISCERKSSGNIYVALLDYKADLHLTIFNFNFKSSLINK